jgi:hypothetical protein
VPKGINDDTHALTKSSTEPANTPGAP